jgi:molecular chaperone Hsp33
MGLKEPYTGTIELMTGEIADDLTYYFASSEQTPSSVGLGVLMDKENFVRQAGGFIIQLMPFTEEETIERLEKKLSTVTSVTAMLEDGKMPEDILEELLGEFGLEITEKMPVRFQCSCSKEMIKNALITLPEADLQEMIDEEEPIEVNCHFCNTNYTFSVEELKTFLTQR